MSKEVEGAASVFGCAAPYRIVVHGAIADSWRERLSGMKVNNSESSESTGILVLEGVLKDQADLSGLMETLYRLHLTIISVQRLRDQAESKGNEQ